MTAQPAEPAHRERWTPDPIRLRLANYTIEDVLTLPDDAPRVELRDGEINVVPSPSFGHQKIGHRLWAWFDEHAPREYEAAAAVGVVINQRNTLEPDIVLLRQPVANEHHYFEPDQVVIAVEVVSPGTKRRDRLEKPASYAAAGIPHYWRIEQDPVHVFAYELVNGEYKLVGDAAEELILERPFDLCLPIQDITP